MPKPLVAKRVVVLGPIISVIALGVVAIVISGNGLRGKSMIAAAPQPNQPSSSQTVTPAARERIRAAYGALPLAFEANQGQSDPRVKYIARGNGYTTFLTANQAVFAVSSAAQSARIGMQLLGANSDAEIAARNELPGRINYYIGNDRSKWQQGVKQYSAVTYREVYPGVNLSFHGNQRQLEFDFIVSPGANPAPIEVGFTGTRTIATDAAGNLMLSSAAGDVMLHKPVAYQEKNGQREPVDAGFVLQANNKVGFELGRYDHSRQLVIDPSVVYASYLGGSDDDEAFAIAVDSSGDAYITGQTKSPTFDGLPAGPNFDVFVSEFNPTANSIVYTSIFNATGTGSGDCSGNAIAVDGSGNAYVGGSATPGFLTTTGVVQPGFGGGALDGFVMKIAGTSGAVMYVTYLGGSGRDIVNGIAVDTASPPNAYVAGDTFSTNFPGTSSSPIQSSLAGSEDNAFIAELNGTGAALTYSTYLGGSNFNFATAIALDSSDNAYITGITAASDFPTTSGVIQTKLAGNQNAYVAQVNAAGSALTYSTYLGGSGTDFGLGIAVDAAGEAYVTGSTQSSNFPTVNAAQSALGGSGATNVFVTKLNSTATALLFSTYYGGSSADAGTAIALDSFGDAYVTGRTTSSNYPVSNSFQGTLNGTSDAFVTEFANTGFVEYSSFFGGPGTENGIGGQDGAGPIGGIAVDSTSNAYLAGDTSSTSGIATSGTLQTTYGGGPADAFVAKVSAAPADFSVAVAPTAASATPGQSSSTITVTVSSVNAAFGQAVNLTCSAGVPSQASCQFSSASVTPGASPATSNLTISTAGSSAMLMPTLNRRMQVFAAMLLPVLGITVVGGGASLRRKKALMLVILTLVLISLMLLPACGGSSGNGGGGGGGGGNGGTPAGTYTITVSGASGNTTHSAPLVLTVN